MISPDDLRETWAILETSPPVAGNLRAREVIVKGEAGLPVLFGLDSSGHRHVLIPVLTGTSVNEDKQSSGVQIFGHALIDQGTRRNFVDLACFKPHLHELFLIVVSEILSRLEENPAHPDRVCHQVLESWRELLEREPSHLPSLEVLAGLFGELWYLREIVHLNPLAVSCWIGPTGSRHDFLAGDTALEVKASLQRYGWRVEIHGHEQLEPPAGGELYLAVLKLEAVDAGEGIDDLVSSLVALGADRHTLLTRLLQLDITHAILDQCKAIRFSMRESRMYRVDENFPCITTHTFAGGELPAGIVKLNYQIDLTGRPPVPLIEEAIAAVYRTIAAKAQA